ncbi:hypothetical protein DM01DRAFT_1028244 [Hesseltinella vesiculosa]|uniref:Uncharacterized protein n=1 Tax=Hesseltinella vesiculosa TaxID=101127 RepID=A0A1X2GK24_9FUNG|nr:hypothetical protein DM01DRAFT_1028244 [Hesseltinella vesiculosa]
MDFPMVSWQPEGHLESGTFPRRHVGNIPILFVVCWTSVSCKKTVVSMISGLLFSYDFFLLSSISCLGRLYVLCDW